MKNTIAIFCICLLLSVLKADGQVMDTSLRQLPYIHIDTSLNEPYKKMAVKAVPVPIYCIYQSDVPDKLNIRDGGLSDVKPYIINGIKLDTNKNYRESYITMCRQVNAIEKMVFDRPFNTTDRAYYTRQEFKEFGIRNFPNIWH